MENLNQINKLKWKNIPLDQINSVHQKNILNIFEKHSDDHIWFGFKQSVWKEAFKQKNKYIENIKKDNQIATIQLIKKRRIKYQKFEQQADDLLKCFPVVKKLIY
jgi:hypothetical protein